MPIETRLGKNGKKSYRARVRMSGYPERSRTFDKKSEAKAWIADTEVKLHKGDHLPSDGTQKTVDDLINRFVDFSLPNKPNNKDQLKVIQMLARWQKEIGKLRVSRVTPAHIANVKEKLLSETTQRGKLRSPATVNRYLAAMSLCFSYAVREYYWLDKNPMDAMPRCKESDGRVRFLDDDERVRLLGACKESRNPNLYLIVLMALTTGARQGEILNLAWSEVDLTNRKITLLQTKNKQIRALPLVPQVAELLEKLKSSKVRHAHYVFPNRQGDGPANIRESFQVAMNNAEIKNFRFHDLRHTAASYLAMNGESLLTIKQILGHKSLAMVNRYAHLTEDHTFAAIEKMNKERFE